MVQDLTKRYGTDIDHATHKYYMKRYYDDKIRMFSYQLRIERKAGLIIGLLTSTLMIGSGYRLYVYVIRQFIASMLRI
jgi:hypothetical protein